MRTTFRLGSLLAVALAVAPGCNGGDDTLDCVPMCPGGFHCTVNGCEADDPNKIVDLAAPAQPDMAGQCSMICAGATPHCNANRLCVACLMDSHCATGQICKTSGPSSICVPGCVDDSRCVAGQKCCDGGCIDVSKDPRNCGACGKACGSQNSTATCAAGACVPGKCNTGWGDCNNDPVDGCETSLRADPKNCTACGMVCDIKNAVPGCSGSDMPPCYIAACKYGFDDCNAEAKDGCETSVLSDVNNCGACAMRCVAPPNAKNTCVNAACVLTSCNAGFADCDSKPANGCEVTVATDVNNCGACGNKCGQGLACINGSCTCNNCVIPGSKTKCVNFVCTFDGCLPGYTNCDNNVQNGCEVQTDSDPKNCGACGNVCPMNTPSCANGQCVIGLDFGPVHSFTGLMGTHYITQGGCGVNNQQNIDDNAKYFCTKFYGEPLKMTCVPVMGSYKADRLVNCGDAKLHKNGGCTGNGNNIPNTMCDGGPCKIGNWAECTSGIAGMICHCT